MEAGCRARKARYPWIDVLVWMKALALGRMLARLDVIERRCRG